jgi:EF hand
MVQESDLASFATEPLARCPFLGDTSGEAVGTRPSPSPALDSIAMKLLRSSTLLLIASLLPAAAVAQESAPDPSAQDRQPQSSPTEQVPSEETAQPSPASSKDSEQVKRPEQAKNTEQGAESTPKPKRSAKERAEADRARLFELADADGDGEISDEERAVIGEMIAKRKQAQKEKSRAKQARDAAATGSTARATEASLQQPKAAEADSRRSAGEQAAKSDGQSTEPNTEEVAPLPPQFQHFDLDGDGVLNANEKRRARSSLNGREAKPADQAGAKEAKGADRQQASRDGARKAARADVESDRKIAIREQLQTERVAKYGDKGGSAESVKPPGMTAMQRRKDAVARERARRAEVQDRISGGGRGTAARAGTALDSYRRLSKIQPKTFDESKGGWASTNRQGVQRGKKRGSEYYRSKISVAGRGGGGRRRGGSFGVGRF